MGLVHGIPTGRTATVLVARKQGVPTTVGHDGHHLGTLWIVGGREGVVEEKGWWHQWQEDRTKKESVPDPTQPVILGKHRHKHVPCCQWFCWRPVLQDQCRQTATGP